MNIQLVERGFPDTHFFGNTFVAMNLARFIPNSVLVSNKRNHTKHNKDFWIDFAKSELDIDLMYAAYLREISKFPHVREEGGLIDLIERELKKESPIAIDFHFPDVELKDEIISVLPHYFGQDIRQFVHLHCLSGFFLGYEGTPINQQRTGLLKKAYDERWVDRFIPVSESVYASYLGILPPSAMAIVHNGVNEEVYTFRPERDRLAFRSQFPIDADFLIGYTGRLDPIKGFYELLRIMEWFDKRPDLNVGFLIASSWGKKLTNLDEELEKVAPRLLRENKVGLVIDISKYTGGTKSNNTDSIEFFSGYVKKKLALKSRLYRGVIPVPLQAIVDLYIQPSLSEGLPLSLIEAVLCGTPTVAYNVGGNKEIVERANGKIVTFSEGDAINRINLFCYAIIESLNANYGLSGTVDSSVERSNLREELIHCFGAKSMASKTRAIYRSY